MKHFIENIVDVQKFQEMQTEAVKRMMFLDIMKRAVHEFKLTKDVYCSAEPFGGLFRLDTVQQQRMNETEQTYGAYVYHAIKYSASEAYLFVMKTITEWADDWRELKQGRCKALCCVYDEYGTPELKTISFVRSGTGGLTGLT